ncbi:YybH family protein [Pseudoduganella violaceinigra]|uniref:YybH family protein n=1 Tax=Pseudoduganella violaceinigra TaxID=246602 RepID=UPI0004027CFD|nr:nuclear transport factor 2 family protein [Pseudoduganella violaceinigra]
MKKTALLALAMSLACTGAFAAPSNAELKQQVTETERAFAATMAKRDHQAFTSFLADEAVFYNGSKVLRGKDTIAAEWKALYEKPEAPFSWEPDQVDVLDSGTLAHSSGPVRDPQGKVMSRFNSVWRLEASGKWRIVFDKGERVGDCKKP